MQVPVVLACKTGHMADVPWESWLHDGSPCSNPVIKYRQRASPRQPSLECVSCGRSRGMSDSESFPCPGERPWLPGVAPETCGQQAQLIERSSTSLYYADTASSLAIPPVSNINPVLLRQLRSNVSLQRLRRVYAEEQSRAALRQIVDGCKLVGIVTNENEVEQHLEALVIQDEQMEALGEDEIRALELGAMLSLRKRTTRGQGQPDLIVEPVPLSDFEDDSLSLGVRLAAVSLVFRLREVRVLRGFGRITPPSSDRPASEGYQQMWGVNREDPLSDADWLPGYEVFGEGILLVLDQGAIGDWLARNQASQRLRSLNKPEYVLVHTCAHLVMRAAAPYAGYPLPSLRERIYDVDGKLGFLIYTTVGDIEGTMGGLVALGKPGRLEPLLAEAVRQAEWCTTDPVCIETGTRLALPTTTAPGACHHCLLLPETSCERGNKYLDRAVAIGAPGDPCGFFD